MPGKPEKSRMKIALIGDYDQQVTAHQAIPQALILAADSLSTTLVQRWIRSSEVESARLAAAA